MNKAAKYVAGGAALAALGYGAFAGAQWLRFGRARHPKNPAEQDPLLDRFMPLYDIVERHQIRVLAPPDVTLAAARDLNIESSAIVRGLFKARELVMGGSPPETQLPPALLAAALAIGWGILADEVDHEIVLGAVTKPWEPNPVFRDLLPRDFRNFAEPGFVKIAWTLRADPFGDGQSIFRSETRAMATDAEARAKFRRYWSLVSPGVLLIRRAMLVPIKAEAERRVSPRIDAPEMVTSS
jgi:hypothetical protein